MTGLNHATQDSTGSNNFDFPNPSSPNAGPSSPTRSQPKSKTSEPEAELTTNPDNPDNPNTAPAADNAMKNQQHPPAKTIPISSPEFFRNPDIQARRARALSAIWQDAGVGRRGVVPPNRADAPWTRWRETVSPPALRPGRSRGDALPGSCSVMHIWGCADGGPRGLAWRYRIAVEE